MNILIACERSGKVREAFRKLGHEAWSCDVEEADDNSIYHFKCKVEEVVDRPWDMMIAFPPCTYLCSSGLHWNKRVEGRQAQTEEALSFVRYLMDADIPRIAIENPIGCISTKIRPPDQYIQPWEFGHDAQKKTCLWLLGLPELRPTKRVRGKQIGKKIIYGNQTPSGQNKLGPSPDRAKLRSETYQGIADAMADQWGGV